MSGSMLPALHPGKPGVCQRSRSPVVWPFSSLMTNQKETKEKTWQT